MKKTKINMTKEGLGYGAGSQIQVSKQSVQLAEGSNLPSHSHLNHPQIKVAFSDRTVNNSNPLLPIQK